MLKANRIVRRLLDCLSDVTSVLTRPITPLDRPKTPATLSNEEILKIIAENSALKNQVQKQEVRISALKTIAKETPGGGYSRRTSVTVKGGKEVEVDATPEELATMKNLFQQFDVHNNGFLTIEDISVLHRKLGEPITESEAKEAFDVMDEEKAGKISFPQFMKWYHLEWNGGDEKSAKMAKYKGKFKFVMAKSKGIELSKIIASEDGAKPSLEWRCRFAAPTEGAGGELMPVSPWHDVPLYNSDGSLNYICEIPKWTRAKNEIATGEPYNPIKQDVKNGVLRDYKWGDMMFNYGAFPRTWEDPAHTSADTGCHGDNDPLDVIEIGMRQYHCGSIVKVKVLGVFAMIDDGETDWKVICIACDDPLSDLLNDIDDVNKHLPGCLFAIREWLRKYKTAEGKGMNTFGLNEICMNREYALEVVKETNEFWKKLTDSKGTTV